MLVTDIFCCVITLFGSHEGHPDPACGHEANYQICTYTNRSHRHVSSFGCVCVPCIREGEESIFGLCHLSYTRSAKMDITTPQGYRTMLKGRSGGAFGKIEGLFCGATIFPDLGSLENWFQWLTRARDLNQF